MSFLLKLILAAFWLVWIPTVSGALFFRKQEGISLADHFLAGYLFLFASAEILTLPMMLLRLPLHILVICYGILLLIAGVFGTYFLVRKQKPSMRLAAVPGHLRHTSLFFWAALLLIVAQVVILVLYAHLDADDALYVGAATTAVDSDSIFRINAYTGIPYVRMPRRYILSPFPIFLAVMSRLCAGLHPAILAHTVFPAVFVPACYVVLYRLGRFFFRDDSHACGIFLFLCTILTWFSAYSVYNAGNFQMIRIWQGKALLAAFLLPLLLYLSARAFSGREHKVPWLLLFMADISGCLLSSMGIILVPLALGISGLLGAIYRRSIRPLLSVLVCCLPSVFLGILYILILWMRGRGLL